MAVSDMALRTYREKGGFKRFAVYQRSRGDCWLIDCLVMSYRVPRVGF